MQQADFDARAKKAEYIPDVSLAFSYYTTANFENVFPSNVGTVGMSLRWEPWDWGRKHQEFQEKRTKEEQAKVGVDATERAVPLEVRNAHRQLENIRARLPDEEAATRIFPQILCVHGHVAYKKDRSACRIEREGHQGAERKPRMLA